MRHEHPILTGVDPWSLGVVLLAVLVLVGVIVWVARRRTVASDGLTPVERMNLPYPHREILSMLRQHGRPMTQSEMLNSIPIDLEDLLEALENMEAKGLIHRSRQAPGNTYLVSLSDSEASVAQEKAEPNGI